MFSCGVWLKQRLVPRTAGDLQVLPESRARVHEVNIKTPGYKGPREDGSLPRYRFAFRGRAELAELACADAHV